MTRSTTFYYPHDRDLDMWRRRHAAGDVPGAWPYGLDAMSTGARPVGAANLPPRSPAHRILGLARDLAPRVLRRRRSIALTWDENAAHSLVRLAPAGRMYSGVIWLPDTVEANPNGDYRSLIGSLRRLDGVWVLSSAQVEPLQRMLGPDGPAVHHVRFGVDADFYTPQPYPSAPLVLSIGGDRHRDPRTLFRALEAVHRNHPSAEIIVQSTSDLAVPRGVTKIAHVSHVELRALYARASVVAIATSPNLHGSGMTVSLEAMATARPVVLTRTPGMEDYIDDGVTGFLTAAGQPSCIAEAIGQVLDDPDAASRMGREGRSAVESDLTTHHLARRLTRIIDR